MVWVWDGNSGDVLDEGGGGDSTFSVDTGVAMASDIFGLNLDSFEPFKNSLTQSFRVKNKTIIFFSSEEL